MQRRVIKSYTTKYINPIVLNAGDVVKLGKEEKEEKWLGWIWAAIGDVSGWIPKQIVEAKENNTGKITEYYTAKELDINEGDLVNSDRELNGWLWVKHLKTGEEGWIPKENVE